MDAHHVHTQLQAGLAQLKARLENELDHLHSGLSSLDPISGDETDQWAHELYQRLIQRRRTTLALFFTAC